MQVSRSQETVKAILFRDGPGYIYINKLTKTHRSRLLIVKSLQDGLLYIRKESNPRPIREDWQFQSPDVYNSRALVGLDSAVIPFGWAEYKVGFTDQIVCVSYYPLLRGSSIHDLRHILTEGEIKMPKSWIWSMLQDMLRAMIDSISRGVLHTDGHASNWLIEFGHDVLRPHFRLADWGEAELLATCNSERKKVNWYERAHQMIIEKVVNSIREDLLAAEKITGSIREHFNRVLRQNSQGGNDQPLYLIQITNDIEDLRPSGFTNGAQWLAALEAILNRICVARENLEPEEITINTRYLGLQPRYAIPEFQLALEELYASDGSASPHSSSNTEPVHAWFLAHINVGSGTPYKIVGMEQRPEAFRYRHTHDIATRDFLSQRWLQMQDNMRTETSELLENEENLEYDVMGNLIQPGYAQALGNGYLPY